MTAWDGGHDGGGRLGRHFAMTVSGERGRKRCGLLGSGALEDGQDDCLCMGCGAGAEGAVNHRR